MEDKALEFVILLMNFTKFYVVSLVWIIVGSFGYFLMSIFLNDDFVLKPLFALACFALAPLTFATGAVCNIVLFLVNLARKRKGKI